MRYGDRERQANGSWSDINSGAGGDFSVVLLIL